jgi:hypothetical protein
MKVSFFRGVGALALCFLLINTLSCAHDQQLVSVSIQPTDVTFGGPDPVLNVQLRALGTYIHPPVTKDITNQVTWGSDTPNLVTVSTTGLIAPAGIYACGVGGITATVTTNSSSGNRTSSGAIVTGNMSYTVDNVAVMGCPGFGGGGSGGSGSTLTVDFSGTGTGTVTSSPPGLACSSACSATFANGTISLTAAASGTSTFGGWLGCDSVSGAVCTINFTTSRVVTVTFN